MTRAFDMGSLPIQLIVNADDYGYYRCVSRGILQAAASGAVTATGILANGPRLEEQIGWLGEYGDLETGIHLVLTFRRPLASQMAEKLGKWEGSFPSLLAMISELLSGRIDLDIVRTEWRTQIETLLGFGIKPGFLNSHEHIHMLPRLFSLASELAEEYEIPHLRLTRAEWMTPFDFSSISRNFLLQGMESVNLIRMGQVIPFFIGLNCSGKLDLTYLKKRFARLKPGLTYELMCHPGLFDPSEIKDLRLLAYHAWEDELALLTGSEIKELLEEFNIRLVNYRESVPYPR